MKYDVIAKPVIKWGSGSLGIDEELIAELGLKGYLPMLEVGKSRGLGVVLWAKRLDEEKPKSEEKEEVKRGRPKKKE